jgi:hypothetical protein
MDDRLTIIKWNIDQHDDTYYEFFIYNNLDDSKKVKLSTIKVVGLGNEIEKRSLTIEEVAGLLDSVAKIRVKYDCGGGVLTVTCPADYYRLRIKSSNFNLDFKWSSDGLYGKDALYSSLNNVIKNMCQIRALNWESLGLDYKE